MIASDKLRWIVVTIALLVAAGFVLTGFLTGTQWLTFVGGILGGGTTMNLVQSK